MQVVVDNVDPYLDGSYWTGTQPALPHGSSSFTVVIDLETMTILAVDDDWTGVTITISEILAAVEQADND